MVLHLEPLSTNQWLDALLSGERGHVIDIGQLTATDRLALNAAVKQGLLVKTRGHWDTMHDMAGLGPLKTIWRLAKRPHFCE